MCASIDRFNWMAGRRRKVCARTPPIDGFHSAGSRGRRASPLRTRRSGCSSTTAISTSAPAASTHIPNARSSPSFAAIRTTSRRTKASRSSSTRSSIDATVCSFRPRRRRAARPGDCRRRAEFELEHDLGRPNGQVRWRMDGGIRDSVPLRYPAPGPQVWGVNFRRVVKWKNEYAHPTAMPASHGTGAAIGRMGPAGTMDSVLETPSVSEESGNQSHTRISSIAQRTTRPRQRSPTTRQRRLRLQIRTDAQPDCRRHSADRLCAGRRRRAAGQPDALQPLLP